MVHGDQSTKPRFERENWEETLEATGQTRLHFSLLILGQTNLPEGRQRCRCTFVQFYLALLSHNPPRTVVEIQMISINQVAKPALKLIASCVSVNHLAVFCILLH